MYVGAPSGLRHRERAGQLTKRCLRDLETSQRPHKRVPAALVRAALSSASVGMRPWPSRAHVRRFEIGGDGCARAVLGEEDLHQLLELDLGTRTRLREPPGERTPPGGRDPVHDAGPAPPSLLGRLRVAHLDEPFRRDFEELRPLARPLLAAAQHAPLVRSPRCFAVPQPCPGSRRSGRCIRWAGRDWWPWTRRCTPNAPRS